MRKSSLLFLRSFLCYPSTCPNGDDSAPASSSDEPRTDGVGQDDEDHNLVGGFFNHKRRHRTQYSNSSDHRSEQDLDCKRRLGQHLESRRKTRFIHFSDTCDYRDSDFEHHRTAKDDHRCPGLPATGAVYLRQGWQILYIEFGVHVDGKSRYYHIPFHHLHSALERYSRNERFEVYD